MKVILDEYGEVLLAVIGGIGGMGISMLLLWNQVCPQVIYLAAGL